MVTKENPVEIKGQKEGLWIYLDDQQTFDDILAVLKDKLSGSNNFFAGADVSIHSGTRELTEEEQATLRNLIEQEHALQVKEILTAEPQAAPAEESSSREESPPDVEKTSEDAPREDDSVEDPYVADEDSEHEDDFMRALDETFRIPVRHKWEYTQSFSSDYLYENEESAFYFRGTVRSGQTLEFPGNIIILGDVNPGAYVIASGDILVMGRLLGVVHAGAEGEERAVVIGATFNPSQLRIAQYIGRPPDEHPRSRQKRSQTEKAYIKDGTIVIEPIL